MNPDDLRSLAGHVDLLDGQRPERLAEVHERIGVVRRRRAVAVSVAATSLVLVVVAGVASYTGRDDAGPGPVKKPDATESTAVDVARPLVYAEGSTIHYGDNQTYDAGRPVDFVVAGGEGFVYVTENDGRRLWFTDGSYAADRIDLLAPGHVGEFQVLAANPGSLVAFESGLASPEHPEIVVYDTRLHEIIAVEDGDTLVAVTADHVYWWRDRPGGELMRFNASDGTQTNNTSWSALQEDLASNQRMLVVDGEITQHPVAFFKLVGRQLVATDSISRGVEGNTTAPTTLVDGRPLRLMAPRGYAGTEESLAAVQWLDDDHLVLFAYHEHNELPRHVGDFLVCPVPSGTCRVVVPASQTPYVPPGDVP